jgi:short-subunit dehydrogenase
MLAASAFHDCSARLQRCCALLLIAALACLAGCATSGRLSTAEQQSVAHKTYVVTGASSGIGRGVVERPGQLHANVVLAARRTNELEKVAATISASGGRALVVTTDVSSSEQMERLAAQAVQRFGRIDVWINNAGIGAVGPFDAIPLADHSRLIDVNLKGVIYGSHIAMRQFRLQRSGVLINVGSVESEQPMAYHASYSASKAGVLSLGRALNEELRLARLAPAVSVVTVMPWATDTPFFTHTANYSGGTAREPAMDDPSKPVNAIVWVSLHPKEELSVGWKAKLTYAGHRIAPDVNEVLSADMSQHWQINTAPPAPPTPGALYQPMAEGTGVDGGIRARMQREDAARKGKTTDPPARSEPAPAAATPP